MTTNVLDSIFANMSSGKQATSQVLLKTHTNEKTNTRL